MSIASAIATKQQQVASAYTACNGKGATMPATENLTNLATCISSIPTGGSAPVITSLSVTPTTSAQTITAPSGTDGYSPVNVAAVTAAIDANIAAGNIKKDVQILGVTGTYEGSGGGGSEEQINYILISSDNKNFTIQNLTKDSNTLNAKATTMPASTSFQAAYLQDVNVRKVNLSNITEIGNSVLGGSNESTGTFRGCTNLEEIDVSNITTLNNYSMGFCFKGTYALKNVEFTSLTTLNGGYSFFRAFDDSRLESIRFPVLTTITTNTNFAYCFNNCINLKNAEFPLLTKIGTNTFYQAFQYCPWLRTMTFPNLNDIKVSQCFYMAYQGCDRLKDLYFPALTNSSFGSFTNQFQNMMRNTDSIVTHTLHFPSNLQSKISTLTGYPLFGGTSGYVVCAFDLPATS